MLTTRISGLKWRGVSSSTQSYSTKAKASTSKFAPGPTPADVHAQRLRRAGVRNAKIARQKMMTPQLEAYFALKHRPTTVKRSKSYLNLVAALGEFPTKYDFDESKLSNEEYIKLGINQEAATSAKLWNIFPNFVKPFVPKINLQVRHADKTSIARGHFLESKKVQEKPSIKYEAKSDSFYTLMMVDPDIPLKSTEHDAWNHYTLVNVPGNDLTQGEVLADWVPPAPPKHTGVHRYIWLLLEQPGKITFTETKRTSSDFDRVIQFDQFIKRHQLKPRGIAFHRTQFDQDVAELYAGWGASATGFHVSDYQPKLIIKPRQYQGM